MRAGARVSKGRRARPFPQGKARASPASGDEQGRWAQQAGRRWLGKRLATIETRKSIRPLWRWRINVRKKADTNAMAGVAIRMRLQRGVNRRMLQRGAGLGIFNAMLMRVVAEMAGHLLMFADTRRRRPTPLERQKTHDENEDEAAHRGRSLTASEDDSALQCLGFAGSFCRSPGGCHAAFGPGQAGDHLAEYGAVEMTLLDSHAIPWALSINPQLRFSDTKKAPEGAFFTWPAPGVSAPSSTHLPCPA